MGCVKYLQGYETDDFMAPLLDERVYKIRQNNLRKIRIFPKEKHRAGIRKTMASTLPWHLHGACELKPNDNDLASQIDGAKHRVGGVTPKPNPILMRRFKQFVRLWMRANLIPLSMDTDVSVETWLRESPYTLDRQEELLTCYHAFLSDTTIHEPKYQKLESFIKDEFYQCPKTFRTINSRIDIYKCLVGPYIHQIEKVIFSLEYFIKKIPVGKRADYITEMMDGFNGYTYTIDFTAFEASFSKMFMDACEIQVVEYMASMVEGGQEFIALYKKLLLSNKLCFSGFLCELIAKRMSGEMSTSVFNGLSNLLLILFTASLICAIVKVIIEGDDSIIVSDKPLTDDVFIQLGFIAKMVYLPSIKMASFCGLIFSDAKSVIREPIHVILKLGWCTQQYNRASARLRLHLLRAKALSLKCEMPNCPILGPLSDRLITLTRGLKLSKVIKTYVANLSLYDRERYLHIMKQDSRIWQEPSVVSPDSRALMDLMYNIDPESQLDIEKSFDSMSLEPFDSPLLNEFIPQDNKIFWDMYVSDVITDIQNSVMYKGRVDYYATNLPLNDATDMRSIKQNYSIRVW